MSHSTTYYLLPSVHPVTHKCSHSHENVLRKTQLAFYKASDYRTASFYFTSIVALRFSHFC